SPTQIEKYMAKISGPLLDRIDIHIEVPAVPFKELATEEAGTSSESMRQQVIAARGIQSQRFAGLKTRRNASMTTRQMRQFCRLSRECLDILRDTVQELGLSARAHDKIRRLARTIADLDSAEAISPDHIREAINYRMLDRTL